ncbi:MAG: FtsX-like permease family protein [Bacteroidales bacterium]|nr:FtsX-like permease family protein [Bacteroidales bacterium]
MSPFQFIFKSLRYFKKQHIAVFLATLISTAVLTGALIVGDSVNYSLRSLVDQRLGKIAYTLVSGDRFVRSKLASEISEELKTPAAALLLLPGIAINTDEQKRINQTQIIGIDHDFWELCNLEIPDLKRNEIYISSRTADQLMLQKGEEILLRINNADLVPLNAPFATEEEPSIAFRMKVKDILHDDQLGRFSLQNNQMAPYNVFINREYLAEKLELSGLSNVIVLAENKKIDQEILNKSFQSNWTLKDAGLQLNNLASENTFQLFSDRIFIDHTISQSIEEANLSQERFLSYFVNAFRFKNQETPYSFVTAASNPYLGEELTNNEIIINSWLADDLNIKIGDTLDLDYFVIGLLRDLKEETSKFIVKKIIPTQDDPLNKALMPSFPGLSDAGNCSDWDAGIPIDLKKIRDKDELYWTHYKGSPKAYISLDQGSKMWDNQYGNFTAIRFYSNTNKAELTKNILAVLYPKDLGLLFHNSRSQGIIAASNGVDFGELFLSLSFFVIAAALLLAILIYSLNLESRRSETGVLYALGFNKKQILRLRISESFIGIILSSLIGGFLGILYNQMMIAGLNSIWNDAIHAHALEIYIKPTTLILGVIIGILISLLSIYFTTAQKLKKTIISIINNQESGYQTKQAPVYKIIAIIGFISAISLLIYSIYNSVEKNAALVLIAGFLFLTACISLASIFLSAKTNSKTIRNSVPSIYEFAFINAGRNKGRSLAVIALLAIGTFTVIVTGANRKTFSGTEDQRQSGTGGYQLWVENTVPILKDLNTPEGKSYYGLENEAVLDQTQFVQFLNLSGDDASCLNLNQVQQPQVLGIKPELFDSQQAFSFAKLLKESETPWLLLNQDFGPNVIPAMADQTVIQWGLMKAIGDTLIYHNEYGQEINLLLVGGLNASIFQGSIMISEKQFIKNFPGSSGSRVMLVNGPKEQLAEIDQLLSNNLADYGVEISSASVRLAAFYSVTNTYLTIFMILGGLGVILGTLGLGIVLMRNMLDRKQELEILKAVGYPSSQIFRLIFTENLFLLIAGILIGFLSAMIGILPSLLSTAFHIPGNFLFVLLLIIFSSGLLWIYIPTKLLLKK